MILAKDIILDNIAVAESYIPILIFFLLSFGLSAVIVILPFFLSKGQRSWSKNTAYECGFDPFAETCQSFDIKFYLVAILFIIFDLEIAFMFPWAVVIKDIGMLGFISMMIFLAVLTVGFAYEWKSGALEWN